VRAAHVVCRASLITVLVCALAACSTLERPVAQQRLPAPIEPVPPPPFDINSIPDAVPRIEPRSAHGNPPFYNTMGKRYYVLGASDGYVERGVASWYGPTFHGVNTSSGERYDMYAMTAAHKTLPLPTYVRVTNLRIDLSYTAAAKLDMLREGTTFVEVRALEPGGTPDNLTRTSEAPPPTLYVQAGAFADQGNAQRAITRLRAAGLATAFIAPPASDKPLLYRVRIGPINDVAAFDQLSAQLATLGFAGARLAQD
jgi:rare lipoprotein A